MGAPPRLLFICDDPAVFRGVSLALRLGLPGLVASGAHDTAALSLALEQGAFDVVITDYQLGWTNGPAVVTAVKERWPECPIVLFSVSGEDELSRDLASVERADPGVELPESVALLAGTVRAALERAELQRERRAAEAALRESEARFRSVFESASDAIVLADAGGAIASWNGGAASMFGYRAEEIVGRALATLVPERHRETLAENIVALRADGGPSSASAASELNGLRRDGTEFPIEMALSAWETGHGLNFAGVIRDVTIRRRAEVAARRSYRRLRRLSSRLAEVQERERTSIAREVHDELGGALTALCMDIAWVRKRVGEDARDTASIQARLEGMTQAVETTIDRVRRISAELRPQILDQLGLAAAIQWQAGEFEVRTGIRCRVRATELRVGRVVGTGLFRAVQECLTNVARHAGARAVEIQIRRDREALILTVRDDGHGITAEAAESPTSLGLRGIQERAALLGGACSVRGGAEGTVVTVTVPARTPRRRPALPRETVA
jgi:PAS domain S-box-containing protein